MLKIQAIIFLFFIAVICIGVAGNLNIFFYKLIHYENNNIRGVYELFAYI